MSNDVTSLQSEFRIKKKIYIDENSLAYNLPKLVVGAGLKHTAERALILYPKSREISIICS